MSGEPPITLVGNLTGDPDLQFTAEGVAWARFTVAVQPRQFDKATNSWKDGNAAFWSCTAWRQMAENLAEGFTKGMRVIVTGTLVQRTYQTKEGEKRTVTEVKVEDAGPSSRFRVTSVRQADRQGEQSTPARDPWSTAPAGFSDDSAPPF
jgi:single-strand DNA-binding protein